MRSKIQPTRKEHLISDISNQELEHQNAAITITDYLVLPLSVLLCFLLSLDVILLNLVHRLDGSARRGRGITRLSVEAKRAEEAEPGIYGELRFITSSILHLKYVWSCETGLWCVFYSREQRNLPSWGVKIY